MGVSVHRTGFLTSAKKNYATLNISYRYNQDGCLWGQLGLSLIEAMCIVIVLIRNRVH